MSMNRSTVQPETSPRAEAAADWAQKVHQIYDFERRSGNFRPDIPPEMIDEHLAMAALTEFKLARLKLALKPRIDQETGENIYKIVMLKPLPGPK